MPVFLGSHVKPQGFNRTCYDLIDAPATTTVDDLLKPESWAHCPQLRAGDEIIVIPQGRPYRAHLFVMDSGKGFAKMRLLGVTALNASLDEEEVDEDTPLYVKLRGPHKYCVLRRSDNEVLKTGFAIKAEAEAWADNHARLVAA